MELKKALSYDQQIERLIKDHNLKIEDKDRAIKILKTVNYYRLSGYGIGLKSKLNKEHYIKDISLNHLFKLYCFDSQFKNNLIRTIEQIEIQLRKQIAYHIAMKYGPGGLMNESNFIHKTNKNNVSIYSIISNNLEKEIYRQKKSPFVKHHIKKYNSKFPIWVSVELMSFGTLSSLFSILQNEDQKEISNLYNTDSNHLKNWILCLVEVRNICAHYTRLYNMPLKQTPNLYKENEKYKGNINKIFPILLILKRMLNSNEQWESLLKDIKKTFEKYDGYFKLSFMNFPDNWYDIL
ncbi:Abi family protein [Helcococcus kunzii]